MPKKTKLNNGLPKHVLEVKEYFKNNKTDSPSETRKIANKLIIDSSDLVTMWRSIEKYSKCTEDNFWVWAFLEAVVWYRQLPKFLKKTRSQQRKLAKEIEYGANSLAILIDENELTEHLIHSESMTFPGFRFYEDFGESNQARIDNLNLQKISTPQLLREIGRRVKEKIEVQSFKGKRTKNFEAIRFARLLAQRNEKTYIYDQPLNAVVATVTNTLYGTNYLVHDIANLRNRQ